MIRDTARRQVRTQPICLSRPCIKASSKVRSSQGALMRIHGVISLALLLTLPVVVHGQGRGGRGRGAQAAASAQAGAPIDLTGYWVSLVTDNWTYRVVTPPKGDYLYLPLNAAARRVADTWDPAKDEAAGEQCKGYGAAAVMRVPGRLHITWDSDTTMKVETEAGTQTRLFHFAGGPAQSTQTNVAS